MKQLLLTLLCVITIAGCNNTTEPVIPDAVTYTSIEYMPIDTSIKYVYKDGGKDTTYRIHVYDMENYPQLYHKYNVEGEVKKYRYEYQLKIGYWDSFHLTAMGVENTNAGTEIAISAYGNAEDTRYALLHKKDIHNTFTVHDTKYSTAYLEFVKELIVNNIRYKDIMVLTETSSLSGYYFQNKYYYAKGVGIIRLSITDNTYKTATMDLLRTYK